jgi:hypothetical protein
MKVNGSNIFSQNRRNVLLLVTGYLFLFALSGCGYRPVGHVAKPVLKGSVSTRIVISLQDPGSTVWIKDALDTAVVNRFQGHLTDSKHATTHLVIALTQTEFIPVSYDANGYITAYNTLVTLTITRTTGKTVKHYVTHGSHMFTIEANAVISDLVRTEAITIGAEKALNAFIAQVANEGDQL